MNEIKSILNLVKGVFLFVKATFADALRIIYSPKESLKGIYGVSFYRNAVYLMMNSGVGLFLGFVFWIVVARLYLVSDVGFGSALLSAAGLLSFVGTLGFGFGIIRYLPTSTDKARLLNFSFTFAALAAIAASLIFLGGLSLWSPKLIFMRQNPIFFIAFVIFVTVATLNIIASQAFVAFRRAGFTLVQSIITGVLKLALVAGLASFFKVFGIFASWGVALAVSLGICLLIFLPQILPHYRPIPSLQRQASNELVPFSLVNYISEGLWSLPTWILPLMILNILGAEANAYFYMAWAMAGLLLAISIGISSSLFAEGSYKARNASRDLKRSLKLLALLLVPAVAILALLGDKLLLAFGREYSVEGTQLLQLLVLAALPASLNLLYLGVARVEKRLKSILSVTGVIAAIALVLSYILLPHLGILGAGVGWLVVQTALTLFTVPKLVQKIKHPDS